MKKVLFLLAFLCALCSVNAQYTIPNKLSVSDKVYGLSKFWQEVNYNFVYLNKVNRNSWDSLYYSMIEQVSTTQNDYDYWQLMKRFCAFLNDGHTGVWSTDTAIVNNTLTMMFGEYWMGFKNVGGHAIVNYTLKKRIKEIPIGSELIEVNGLPTAEYIQKNVMPYVSSSTDYVREDEAIRNVIAGLQGTSYKIKLKRPNGTIFPLTLTHERTIDTAYYPSLTNKPLLELKWYPNDVAYLALNSFGNEKIDTMFLEKLSELKKAKSLILDLRNNGGGSTGIGIFILCYLTNDTLLPHAKYYTRENLAAFKAWGKYVTEKDTVGNSWNTKCWLANHDLLIDSLSKDYQPWTNTLEPKRVVVPTAVLIGHNTASAAEDFLISADGQKHFKKIGERSYGSTGQPLMLDLPGGGARICTKKDTYPDGREFVGVGVIPDIEVKPTVDDFIKGKDPVLERALQYLNGK
ncbi:S41 family peptidase [Rhizosphaericola mali]|uniref:Peptidase S41 n=1 Tax=Rhizosphaericola mali TaxID=2545455 RepID=A0A5P2G5Q0_9BACT|nr:S41 family peptidase [Rhizosphaericola mali]QES89090.1 peptidase S41 [Rhizosphaericola mali]